MTQGFYHLVLPPPAPLRSKKPSLYHFIHSSIHLFTAKNCSLKEYTSNSVTNRVECDFIQNQLDHSSIQSLALLT